MKQKRIDDGNRVTRLVLDAEVESVSLMADGSIAPAGRLKRWIDLNDHVLVDPRSYFEPKAGAPGTVVEGRTPFVWGQVDSIAPGDAAVYPIKVSFLVEDAGFAATGQYKPTEILAVRHGESEPEYWRDICVKSD